MDRWKYYAITHRDHAVLNPTSPAKLDELAQLFDLRADASVLDIACGKGEVLLRVLGRYRCAGVGIDLSPYFIRDARERALTRLPRAKIELREATAQPMTAQRSLSISRCASAKCPSRCTSHLAAKSGEVLTVSTPELCR